MATVKSRKVETGTMKLKRYKNDSRMGGKYEYYIEFPDGDRAGPFVDKSTAERQFDQNYNIRKSNKSSVENSVKDMLGF